MPPIFEEREEKSMTCRLLHLQNEQEWIKASSWLDARYNPGNAVEDQVREFLSAVREKGDDAQ